MGESLERTGFRNTRLTMPFEFEIQNAKGQVQDTYVLPINPEQYSISDAPRSKVHFTQGGAYEDGAGLGLAKITLAGTFTYGGGYTVPITKQRGLASNTGLNRSGQELYKELLTTFHHFYEDYHAARRQADNGLPIIIFRDLGDQRAYRVRIDTFTFSRNLSRRMLHAYNIQMTGLERIEISNIAPSFDDPVLNVAEIKSIEPPLKEVTTWTEIMDGYRSLHAGVSDLIELANDAIEYVDGVSSAVNSFLSGVTTLIEMPFALLNSAVSAINSVRDSFETMYAAGANLPAEFDEAWINAKLAIGVISNNRDKVSDTETTVDTTAAGARAGSSPEILSVPFLNTSQVAGAGAVTMNIPELTLFDDSLLAVSDVASSSVTIMDGETLASVAAKHLGNPDEWIRIALLNDLEYPYDLEAGAELKLPAEVGEGRPIVPSKEGTFADKLFGIDESLDSDGEHPVDGTGAVETVGGYENLEMQISHRLQTKRGELAQLGHPEYGSNLPDYIGQLGTDETYERALIEAKRSVLGDPRISEIRNGTFSIEGTAIYFECDAVPINRTEAQRLRLPVTP